MSLLLGEYDYRIAQKQLGSALPGFGIDNRQSGRAINILARVSGINLTIVIKLLETAYAPSTGVARKKPMRTRSDRSIIPNTGPNE